MGNTGIRRGRVRRGKKERLEKKEGGKREGGEKKKGKREGRVRFWNIAGIKIKTRIFGKF